MKHPVLFLSLTLNLVLLTVTGYVTYKMGYLGRFLIAAHGNNLSAPTDTLSTRSDWQETIQFQQMVSDRQHYKVCLFGDSISAQVGNTLGNDTFNFAIPGMSTISQLEQLMAFTKIQFKCDAAIVAIGTNDASYRTTPDQFERNLTQILTTLKQQLNTQKLILLPAFYSTSAASRDPAIAGTVDRVEAINAKINQVAQAEKISVLNQVTQPLFSGQALREDLTIDGVHLNLTGKQIYRSSLIQLVQTQR